MTFFSNGRMRNGEAVSFKDSGAESASTTHRYFHTDAGSSLYVVVDVTAVNAASTVTAAVASTANLTLSNTQTIDTVAVTAGQVVLVKDQTDAKTNGLYTVVSGGAWTRTADALDGAVVAVTAGAVGAGKKYKQTTAAPVVGTDNIVFALSSDGTLVVTVEATADGTNWFKLGTIGSTGYVAGTATAPTAFSAPGTVRAAFPAVQDVRTRSTVTNTVTYSVSGIIA